MSRPWVWTEEEKGALEQLRWGSYDQQVEAVEVLRRQVRLRERRAWEHGFATGKSRAMRYMSDEPGLSLDVSNPHDEAP